MTYFHVRVSVRGERHDELKTDMDEDTLERQFLEPYRKGEPITINGRSIAPELVDRIRISASEWQTSEMVPVIKREIADSGVIAFGGPSVLSRAAARATDVTDQYITGPIGFARDNGAVPGAHNQEQALANSVAGPGDRTSVFVVTGRDNDIYAGVVAFLRALGLRIVEWEQALAKTGLPNPYVGDVVQMGLSMADAVVVLFTPDDVVQLRENLVHEDDPAEESQKMGQARPNVYYEAGIADTLGRERTVLVEVGKVKAFSDAAGRHVVRYDGSAAKRNAFAERLKLAGLQVDRSGSAWLTDGDIQSAISAARSGVEA